MNSPNGAVLYRGPSLIDGSPIVCIATGLASASANAKTGGLIQTYILRADVSPVDAVKSGADVSICGACPHRGDGSGKGRTCYVNVGQGPLAVYRAFQRGAYPDASPGIGAGRLVRLGTYGDPAAVPVAVWQALLAGSVGSTGYSHQWRTCDQSLSRYCMASVDSAAEAAEASAAGWRYFRVALPCDAPRLPSEAICPASAEAGKKLQCADCLACSGANGRRGNIVIQAHGGFAVMANIKRRAIAAGAAA